MTPRLTSIIITTHTQQWYINKKWQVRRRQWRRRRRKDADRWLLAIKRWLHGSLIYTPFFLRSCCCYVQSGIIIRDFYQETVVFIIFTIAATLYFIFSLASAISRPRDQLHLTWTRLCGQPLSFFFPLLCRYVSIKGRLIASSQHTHTQEEEED